MSYNIAPLSATFGIDSKDLFAIEKKAKHAPEKLSDYDLQVLLTLDGEEVAQQAARRREEARRYPAPPLPRQKAAPSSSVVAWPPDDAHASAETLEAWAATHADAAIPALVWERYLAKNRELRQRLESRVTVLETAADALAARVAGLEQARAEKGVGGAARWGGVYETNHKYFSGEIVTDKGNLWICSTSETASSPGSTPSDWTLILRRGKQP